MSEQVQGGALAPIKSRQELATVPLERSGFGGALMPQTFSEVVMIADFMSRSDIAVPAHLRGNPGACMAVAIRALRWEMEPFAVAEQTYVVKGVLCYMAQLVAAVVTTRAPIKGEPEYEFLGSGPTRQCRVTCTMRSGKPLSYTTPEIGKITVKNSPLWVNDPDQQLGYYAIRAWGRRHASATLLGVWTPDDITMGHGPVLEHEPAQRLEPPAPPAAKSPPAQPVEASQRQERKPSAAPPAKEPIPTGKDLVGAIDDSVNGQERMTLADERATEIAERSASEWERYLSAVGQAFTAAQTLLALQEAAEHEEVDGMPAVVQRQFEAMYEIREQEIIQAEIEKRQKAERKAAASEKAAAEAAKAKALAEAKAAEEKQAAAEAATNSNPHGAALPSAEDVKTFMRKQRNEAELDACFARMVDPYIQRPGEPGQYSEEDKTMLRLSLEGRRKVLRASMRVAGG